MFRLLDNFLQALNDGAILRGVISRILHILAWIRFVGAVLVPLLSLASLRLMDVQFALGTILVGLAWGSLLFAGACLENYRARQIEALPNSPRMTSWIWVNLLRLAGEEALVFFVSFGAATCAGVTFLGQSSFSFLPGLGGLSFIAGIAALIIFSILGGLSFVAFTIVADLISSSLDSADSLRLIASQGGFTAATTSTNAKAPVTPAVSSPQPTPAPQAPRNFQEPQVPQYPQYPQAAQYPQAPQYSQQPQYPQSPQYPQVPQYAPPPLPPSSQETGLMPPQPAPSQQPHNPNYPAPPPPLPRR